jgi:uncharacterized protein
MKSFQDIQNTIVQYCMAHTVVMAAYVFGSVAAGKARATSDLDVALLLDPSQSSEFSVLEAITHFEQTLNVPVDVVILNTANEHLKYNVRRSGKLVFDRNPRFRKDFEILSRKMYEDFLYVHRKYVQKVLYSS